MNLKSKKELAMKTFNVGRDRVMFVQSRLSEIKEALTKQDIRELEKRGAIVIKDVKGRRKIIGRKRRRGVGNIKKKVNVRKKNYVIMTRKLRGYVAELKKQGKLSAEEITEIRKRIRNKKFRSKAHLREHIGGFRK